MKPQFPRGPAALGRAAEARRKELPSSGLPENEKDWQRLRHELEVHQIELELQNEELRAARNEVEAGLKRYTELYDFAPVGYFSLTADGTIQLVNLTGAGLVGAERGRLQGRRFGLLVAEPDRKAFSDFLSLVFANDARQTCELTLAAEGRPPLVASVAATRSPDGRECQAMVIDITRQREAEKDLRRRNEVLGALAEAGAKLLRVPDWRPGLQSTFAALGEATKVSRVYLFERHQDGDGQECISQRAEWVAGGIIAQLDNPGLQDFKLEGSGVANWIDRLSRGEPVTARISELPEPERSFLEFQQVQALAFFPVMVQEKWWGFLGFDDGETERVWSPAELNALRAASSLLGAAIARHQALAALAESEQAMRALAGSLQQAREAERTLIAREVHDQIDQSLTGLNLDIIWLQRLLEKPGERATIDAPLGERLERMSRLVRETVVSVQQLCAKLRPGILDDLGLTAALEWQAEEFTDQTGVSCVVRAPRSAAFLATDQATVLYRIFQEALTNIVRHARASKVVVKLARTKDSVRFEVMDDGVGMSPESVKHPTSLGLLGMRERAAGVGGEVSFESETGRGTTVKVRLPLES